ncbi:uncharacterized protein LOC125468138 isoform X4 [Pyrus x bretschneideri]|uniref:uncharacterized protein LOC125468138 isoform X4 n=1 Tax=Pyrus x bretschneideri TaxID=225117 RepID=UPI00202E99AF|nr:uncharacterized protein LOC125468138 isoform X4 [Pyrus x bretschneideri]
MLQVNQADKIQKENSTSVASNAHGEPKPTNLKPFRFRSDERGMFKEATSDKKVHAPLKEIALVRTPGAKSTSKHQNVIHVYLGAASAFFFVIYLMKVSIFRQNIGPVGHI